MVFTLVTHCTIYLQSLFWRAIFVRHKFSWMSIVLTWFVLASNDSDALDKLPHIFALKQLEVLYILLLIFLKQKESKLFLSSFFLMTLSISFYCYSSAFFFLNLCHWTHSFFSKLLKPSSLFFFALFILFSLFSLLS